MGAQFNREKGEKQRRAEERTVFSFLLLRGELCDQRAAHGASVLCGVCCCACVFGARGRGAVQTRVHI